MDGGFGKWLGEQMAACGFVSNVELEHQTGIGNTTISRWRNGTMAPSVEQLRKLERPLRTPLLELLVRAGVLSPDEAKVSRERLAKATEAAREMSAPEAIKHDPRLMETAKEHLLRQYDLLAQLSDLTDTTDTAQRTSPLERPLRVAARPRPGRRHREGEEGEASE